MSATPKRVAREERHAARGEAEAIDDEARGQRAIARRADRPRRGEDEPRRAVIISAANFRAAARGRGWDLAAQLRTSHDPFVPHAGTIPDHSTRPDGARCSLLQQRLQIWQADLGARDRTDWTGFHRSYRRLLEPLLALPRLGALDARELRMIADVVDSLESYKHTAGRALVFGSKSAHFHFPWLVPVVSSEVRRGLLALQRHQPHLLAEHLSGPAPWFRYQSAAETACSYGNYLALGNALMRSADGVAIHRRRLAYGIDAKVFEWCVVAFDPELGVGASERGER